VSANTCKLFAVYYQIYIYLTSILFCKGQEIHHLEDKVCLIIKNIFFHFRLYYFSRRLAMKKKNWKASLRSQWWYK